MNTNSLIARIYLATNIIDGKQYVGFTIRTIRRRWKSHVKGDKGSSRLLHEAIKQFGECLFHLEQLFEGSTEEALRMETYYIKKYNTFGKGYNLSWGGEAPFIGRKHSEKSKVGMSKSWFKKGSTLSKQHKKSISKAHKGKIVPQVTRDKLSAAAKIQWADPNAKIRKVKPYLSPEARESISRSRKGSKASLETRARQSKSQKLRQRNKGYLIYEGRRAYFEEKTCC